MFFTKLTDTRWAVGVLLSALLTVYVALPLVVDMYFLPNPHFAQLAQISLASSLAIAGGYFLPLFDGRFESKVPRIAVSSERFHAVVWGAFVAFLVITFATASAVPIISAIQGADPGQLAQERGDFLKTRVGIEAALIYFSTLFVSALLPYSLARQFMQKSKFRYYLLVLFLAYSVSFLQKALFINVLFPLLYLAARNRQASTTRVLSIVLGSAVLLYLISLLAFGGAEGSPAPASANFGDSNYFVATYLPGGTLEYLVWRTTAVPMFSAADTLAVHAQQFGAEPLWGATSSFFAGLFGMERVPMERLVSEFEWGWSDIANTNSVYITEAFVNFGWVGAIAFSMFVGQSLRWFRKSRDEAFKSLWLIYCFAIFNSGLIGTLLSNGYLLIFGMAFMVRLKDRRATSRTRRAPVIAAQPSRLAAPSTE